MVAKGNNITGGGILEQSEHKLEASLHARHVAMIAIGGIIGAGLFVGSSTSIVQIGPGPRTLVKVGARVFIPAAMTPGGLATNSVAVGANGSAPPM